MSSKLLYATISTAIEGISNFNRANDPEKTAKYLDISSGQLKKLNGMVEKLLETASLDSDELDLSLEPVEVVHFTRQIFERLHLLKGDKELSFQTSLVDEFKEVDVFHMENAISNLVDNALKYGGNKVQLSLDKAGENLVWKVTDNGVKLDKTQQTRIFDKFYRVPTGNVHDVKGFGYGANDYLKPHSRSNEQRLFRRHGLLLKRVLRHEDLKCYMRRMVRRCWTLRCDDAKERTGSDPHFSNG